MKKNYAKPLDKMFASAQQSKTKEKLRKKLAERTIRPMKTTLHELIEADASIEKLREELAKEKSFSLVNIPDPTNKHSTPLCALIIRFAVKKALQDGTVLEGKGQMDFCEDMSSKLFTKMGLTSAEAQGAAIKNSLFPPLPENKLDRDVDKEDVVQTKSETGTILNTLFSSSPVPVMRPFNEDDLIERAALLIEYGADLTLYNETGKPLELAIAYDMPKLVIWLLKKGAKTDVLANPILQGAIQGAGVGRISQTLAHILTLEPKQYPALFGPNPNITRAELIDHRYVHSGDQTLLHTSIMHGRLKILSFLVEQGADINLEDNCKRTPLMLAEQRKFEKAAWYLREVSTIQSQGTDKETQKKEIYKLGQQLTVEDCGFAILDRIDFDGRIGNSGQPSSSFRNMLLYASELESLVCPTNTRSNTQLTFQREEPEASPLELMELQPLSAAEKAKNKLMRAVKKGDLRRVQHIAENTEPTTFQKWLRQSEALFSYEDSFDTYPRTMVEYALDEGKKEIFNFLLEYATKINLELKLLSRAVAFANLNRLKALVKLEPQNGLPTKLASLLVKALYEASIIKHKLPLKEEYKRIIFYLLDRGIAPNVTSTQFHGFTALHMAAYCQDLEMIQSLIAYGNDASFALPSENPAHAFLTPLHVMLLKNFLKEKEGKTHPWNQDKAFAIVKFLIEQQGVDVNTGQRNRHTAGPQLSSHANTPLDYAINHGEWKIAFYLYQKGGKCQPSAAEFFYAKFPDLDPSKILKEKEFLAQEQQEKWQLAVTLLKKYLEEFVNDELLEKAVLNGNQLNIEFNTATSAKEFKEALLLVFTPEIFQFNELSWQDNHVSFPIDRLCRQEQIKQNAKKNHSNKKNMFTKKEYSLLSEKYSLLRSLLASHAMLDSTSSAVFRLSRADLYEYRFKKPEALTSTMLANFNRHTRGKCQLEERKRTKKGKQMDCVLLVEKAWIDAATPEEVKDFTEQIMKVDLQKEAKIESVTFEIPSKQPVSLDPVMREERERRDRLNKIKQQTYKDQPPKPVSHRGKPLAVENNGQGEQNLNQIEKPVTTQGKDMPKRSSSSLNFSWMHNTDKPGPLEESIFLSEHESSSSLCKEEPKKISKNQARKNKRATMSLAEFSKKLAEEEAEQARLTQEEKKIHSQWYNDEKVSKLIAYYIRDKEDVDCLVPMLGTDWRGNNTLRDNLADYNAQRAQLIAKGQSIKDKILIPINLHNGHWVLLYIIYQQDMAKTQQIYYFDPMGTVISEDLYKAIVDERVFPGHPIIQLGQRVQTDFYNCGPWVVEAARTFIDSGTPPESTLDIHAARAKHTEIIRTEKARNASLQPAMSSTKSHFHHFLAAESATTKQAASPSRTAQEGESSSNISVKFLT